MKRMSKILCLLLALCLLPALAQRDAEAANTAVQEAREGVARILLAYEDQPISTGTGFFVGRAGEPVEYLVTNRHVVTIEDETGATYLADEVGVDIYVIFDDVNSSSTLKATIVHAFGIDLAILRLSEPVTIRKPMTLMSARQCQVTDTVYAIGYPGVSDDYGGGLIPGSIDYVTVTGPNSITKAQWVHPDGSSYLQHNVEINGGNSGGPLVTEEGYVVGVNTLTSADAAATNYALYIDYAMEYLDKAGIPYLLFDRHATPEPSPTPEPTPSPTLAPTAGPTVAVPTPEPAQDGASGGGWYWLIIAVVVLAALAAAVWLVLRSRRQHAQPEAQPAPAATRELVGEGVANPLGGRAFALSGTLTIGRDPLRCQALFPPETPGVSAVHCCLTASAGGAALIDMNSTYGTFLGDGTRLEPGVSYTLRVGESFFLGARENGFTLR